MGRPLGPRRVPSGGGEAGMQGGGGARHQAGSPMRRPLPLAVPEAVLATVTPIARIQLLMGTQASQDLQRWKWSG